MRSETVAAVVVTSTVPLPVFAGVLQIKKGKAERSQQIFRIGLFMMWIDRKLILKNSFQNGEPEAKKPCIF